MINAKKNGKGVLVEARGSMVEVMDELTHAAYSVACGMLESKGKKIDPEAAAIFMLALLEGIDLLYRDETGDKRGCLDRCERLILMRMSNPDRLSEDVTRSLKKRGVVQ